MADSPSPSERSTKVHQMRHRDGVPWWHAPLGPKLTHRCRWQTRAYVGPFGLELVERCACGAFGPEPFMRIDPYPTREQRRKRTGQMEADYVAPNQWAKVQESDDLPISDGPFGV